MDNRTTINIPVTVSAVGLAAATLFIAIDGVEKHKTASTGLAGLAILLMLWIRLEDQVRHRFFMHTTQPELPLPKSEAATTDLCIQPKVDDRVTPIIKSLDTTAIILLAAILWVSQDGFGENPTALGVLAGLSLIVWRLKTRAVKLRDAIVLNNIAKTQVALPEPVSRKDAKIERPVEKKPNHVVSTVMSFDVPREVSFRRFRDPNKPKRTKRFITFESVVNLFLAIKVSLSSLIKKPQKAIPYVESAVSRSNKVVTNRHEYKNEPVVVAPRRSLMSTTTTITQTFSQPGPVTSSNSVILPSIKDQAHAPEIIPQNLIVKASPATVTVPYELANKFFSEMTRMHFDLQREMNQFQLDIQAVKRKERQRSKALALEVDYLKERLKVLESQQQKPTMATPPVDSDKAFDSALQEVNKSLSIVHQQANYFQQSIQTAEQVETKQADNEENVKKQKEYFQRVTKCLFLSAFRLAQMAPEHRKVETLTQAGLVQRLCLEIYDLCKLDAFELHKFKEENRLLPTETAAVTMKRR